MTTDELRELLILVINRNTSTLDASSVEDTAIDGKLIGIEVIGTDDMFFLEITEV
jgi:hypothetical protein